MTFSFSFWLLAKKTEWHVSLETYNLIKSTWIMIFQHCLPWSLNWFAIAPHPCLDLCVGLKLDCGPFLPSHPCRSFLTVVPEGPVRILVMTSLMWPAGSGFLAWCATWVACRASSTWRTSRRRASSRARSWNCHSTGLRGRCGVLRWIDVVAWLAVFAPDHVCTWARICCDPLSFGRAGQLKNRNKILIKIKFDNSEVKSYLHLTFTYGFSALQCISEELILVWPTNVRSSKMQ